MDEGPLVFILEWFDELAAINKQFVLLYYPDEPAVQINHTKSSSKHGGCFLKKVQYPNLLLEDLYIGNKFEIFSRKYTVVDYGDDRTRSMFQSSQGKSFLLIKPDGYPHVGNIIDRILQEGLKINRLKMAFLKNKDVCQYFAQAWAGGDTQVFKNSLQLFKEDAVVGIEVEGEKATGVLNTLWGPPNPDRAKDIAPNSFTALYGTDLVKNAVYWTPDENDKDWNTFFNNTSYNWVLDNCTWVIIKPHCFSDGSVGQIIDTILNENYEISGMALFNLKMNDAKEFFEFSWSQYPSYKQMLEHMIEGPLIALEVRGNNIAEEFQELAGDIDPKDWNTNTLRGKYGHNQVHNAIYCSSDKNEAIMECEYFFTLLDE